MGSSCNALIYAKSKDYILRLPNIKLNTAQLADIKKLLPNDYNLVSSDSYSILIQILSSINYTLRRKLSAIFELFDANCKGCLNTDEFKVMIHYILKTNAAHDKKELLFSKTLDFLTCHFPQLQLRNPISFEEYYRAIKANAHIFELLKKYGPLEDACESEYLPLRSLSDSSAKSTTSSV